MLVGSGQRISLIDEYQQQLFVHLVFVSPFLMFYLAQCFFSPPEIGMSSSL